MASCVGMQESRKKRARFFVPSGKVDMQSSSRTIPRRQQSDVVRGDARREAVPCFRSTAASDNTLPRETLFIAAGTA
jgi:hypothetical protein